MSRRRKILLILLAPLLLLPSAALYVVVTTEWGLQMVVSRLGKAGPVTITAGTVTGTLVDGFTVDRLRIQHRWSDMTIERASGRIQLLPLLLLQRVTLPEVKAAHVNVIVRRPATRPNREPRFLPSMLRIDADSVHVDTVDVLLLSGKVVKLRNIDSALTVYPKQIRVRSAQGDHELVHIVANGHLQAARPLGLDGEAELSWRIAGQPDWLILAKFDGDLAKLPIEGRVERPFHADIEGTANTLNRGWDFAGHARVHDLDLQKFGAGTVLGIISGDLDITSTANAFTARGTLTPPGLKAGAFGVNFRGSYRQKVVTIDGATVTHAASGARATTRGDVTVMQGGPLLDLAGQWSRFRWPLLGAEPAFESPQGRFTLSGARSWSVTLEGDVIAAGQDAMPSQLQGLLTTESMRIDDATVQALGGTARFTGEARWKPAETWRIAGGMNDLDISRLRADLPGQASFDFVASGAPFGAEGSLDFAAERISGRLRGQNLGGKGRIARATGSSDWQFRGVDMSLGRTRLQLDGSVGEHSDLTFAINADDLSLFDAEARGRVNASGRFAGTRQVPQLQLRARGTDFEWRDYKLAALDADVDLDMRPEGHARGHVNATQLTIGSRTLAKANVELSGSGASQRLTMAVDAAPYASTLVAQGAMKEGLWQGMLQNLTVQDSANLRLTLEAPATLALNLKQQQLGQTCLKGAEERLCVTARRQPDGIWNANLTADTVPLRAFTAGLTQNIDYEGTINVQAELAGNSTDLPTGAFQAQLQNALLRHRLGNGREERLSLGSGTVTGNATTTAFTVEVGLDAGQAGSIKGELTGERNAGDWRNYPVRGVLDANTDGLALLDIYVGGIDKASGRLITKVDIGGTLGEPDVQGLLQLRDASIDIYQVNLSMRDLSLDAKFDTQSLDISGSSRLGATCAADSPECRAKFSGKLTWKDGEPYGDLHLEGTKLRVVDIPEARIDASPKLDFRIDGHRIRASGEVGVPHAMLEPADLTNVVLVSSDQRIVGAEVVDPAQRWLVAYDIRVMLGEDVRIESLGLRGRLGGSITVRGDETRPARGDGDLSIAEGGRFNYLGRQFDIARGRLIYDNVPLTDPGVDLRAQKVYPDVTAGINVRGPLRSPVVTFFSEPALPRSQIESLVLSGSLESAQNSNRSGAARNAIITQGLSIAAQRMGSRIGITDVGLETDLSNDTSVVLGKYLTPRLYVSYGISLAEAINTLKMRYTIGDRWTIKTEAGKARSADIVYTIQKK